MRLLLDTHIWLWGRLEPKRIPRRIKSAIGKSTNELWFSPVSTWEVLLLCRRGRLWLDPDPVAWIEKAMEKMPMREAPATQEVALATRAITLPHYDPADALLAATARAYDLTLVTADAKILAGSGFKTLANR